jgi:transcriptional regulator with PAS, ATPase and Fis domain
MQTPLEMHSHYEPLMLRIDVVTRIPDLYFIPKNELQQRINQYQDIINLSRPIMSYFAPNFDNKYMHLNLIDPDGCILHSLEDDHVGAVCPGFIYINNNPAIKESLLQGAIVDLYSIEADEGLVSMPILTRDSAVCLTITSMKGRIPSDYLRMAFFIYQMLYAQYRMVSEFDNAANTLIDLNSESTLIVNEDGIITGANAKCMEFFGVGSKDIITGIHVNEIVDDYRHLLDLSSPCVGENFMIYARDEWRTAELLERKVLQMPVGGKHTVLSFRFHPSLRVIPTPEAEQDRKDAFQGIIGSSPEMKRNITIAHKVAALPSTVLIEGESGTGKELIAHGIHWASGRKGPFVAINCGSLSKELLHSELFGYADGAFTGAKKGGKTGKFKLADKGTIFLDEIGEMSEEMQVSLLRFMQDKMIIPLADNKPQKVDVRIIAATNRNLRQEVETGNFREDLYYRLNVVNIKMPPLRERKEDIPLLANYILQDICTEYGIPVKTFNKNCMKKFTQYDWPGNVRELRNIIERALIVSSGDRITADDLLIEKIPQSERLIDREYSTIVELLGRYDGNISATAKTLGIARTTLYRKMKKLGIEVNAR